MVQCHFIPNILLDSFTQHLCGKTLWNMTKFEFSFILLLISFEILLNFALNLLLIHHSNLMTLCFSALQFFLPLFPGTFHFSESLVFLSYLCLLFSCIWDPSSLCKHYRSYVLRLCDFLYWLANKVLFALLLQPKVAISPSAPTEWQTVNKFGHITNGVSAE